MFLEITFPFFVAASVVSSTSGGSSPENNNYLRVSAAFGQRRLSDNVLTAPGNRRLSGKGMRIFLFDLKKKDFDTI